jgi:flagellar basal-body rod protein FlgB
MGMLDADALVALLKAGGYEHSLIANNLANVNTPGYRALRMRFTEQLEAALDAHGGLVPGKQIVVEAYRPLFSDVGADGNDVSLEREVTELNKNALEMQFYLAVLSARIAKLRVAMESR